MRKLLICASMLGLSAGVVYWLCKREKIIYPKSYPAPKSLDHEVGTQDIQKKIYFQNADAAQETKLPKSETVQNIYDRHCEAGEIMKNAYRNIMEDFVQDISDEKFSGYKGETQDVIIDEPSISLMKEIDLTSDELDELLK